MNASDESSGGISSETAIEAFDILWRELSTVIGSAATAAVMQRAIKAAMADCPILRYVTISMNGQEYMINEAARNEKCARIAPFIDTVLAMLRNLTGKSIVDHLLENPLIKELSHQER